MLELLRIVEALKGDARSVFADIVARRGRGEAARWLIALTGLWRARSIKNEAAN